MPLILSGSEAPWASWRLRTTPAFAESPHYPGFLESRAHRLLQQLAARRCTARSVSSSRFHRLAAAAPPAPATIARQLTAVDQPLPPPRLDRLVAHLEQP